ncbi:MAG: hypothetical protein IJA79_09065 [Desulfovibrio sp.]|nr:hypothetical protein [Desulfovibrio sp.]
MSIKRGLARVQFIACHSEIVELLEQGYTVRNIYDDFVSSKKISMSYTSFARYIQIRIKKAEEYSNKTTNKEQSAKTQDKKQEQEIQQEKAKINSITPKIKEKKNESIEAIQFDSYKDFI